MIPSEAERTILDLGAGYGEFLDFMRIHGWSVRGIEPSEYCLKTSQRKNCNIIQADLDDIGNMKLDKSYSVITLNTVLEHYPYPEKLLKIIRDDLMDSNTILHIEVPNDFSLLQEVVDIVCDQNKYWLCPLGHLNYWTHATLNKFVNRLGFKVEAMESTFPLEIMAILGDDYITSPEKGRGIHMQRVELERKLYGSGNIDLKLQLYQTFAQMGIGREVLLYLSKV